MDFWNDYLTLPRLVKSILLEKPETRDCDALLIHYVWKHEMIFKKEKDVLTLLKENSLSCTESIARMRRKLQEKHADLRGELYNKRHGLKESVRSKICQYTFEFTGT